MLKTFVLGPIPSEVMKISGVSEYLVILLALVHSGGILQHVIGLSASLSTTPGVDFHLGIVCGVKVDKFPL